MLITLLQGAIALAAPVQMTVQARVLDADGSAITDTDALTVTLYDDASSNAAEHVIHVESQPATPIADGYVTVVIGANPANPLDSGDLAVAALWYEVAIGGQLVGPRAPIRHTPRAAVAERTYGAVQDDTGLDGACPFVGAIAFDGTLDTLKVCASTGWAGLGGTSVGLTSNASGERYWADDATASSCAAYLTPPEGRTYDPSVGGDGLYLIDPDGPGSMDAFAVYCDMTGGGWALVGKVNGDSQHGTESAVNVDALRTPTFNGSGKYADTLINTMISDTWRLQTFSSAGAPLHTFTAADAYGGIQEWYSVNHPNLGNGQRCGSNPNNYCGQRTADSWGDDDEFLWYHTYSGATYTGVGYYERKGLLWVR